MAETEAVISQLEDANQQLAALETARQAHEQACEAAHEAVSTGETCRREGRYARGRDRCGASASEGLRIRDGDSAFVQEVAGSIRAGRRISRMEEFQRVGSLWGYHREVGDFTAWERVRQQLLGSLRHQRSVEDRLRTQCTLDDLPSAGSQEWRAMLLWEAAPVATEAQAYDIAIAMAEERGDANDVARLRGMKDKEMISMAELTGEGYNEYYPANLYLPRDTNVRPVRWGGLDYDIAHADSIGNTETAERLRCLAMGINHGRAPTQALADEWDLPHHPPEMMETPHTGPTLPAIFLKRSLRGLREGPVSLQGRSAEGGHLIDHATSDQNYTPTLLADQPPASSTSAERPNRTRSPVQMSSASDDCVSQTRRLTGRRLPNAASRINTPIKLSLILPAAIIVV